MPAKSLIILGGGPGGYAAALEAARRKMAVTLIEEQDLGGTCLNRGCIPSKFLLTQAKVCADALRLAESGVLFRLEKIRLRALLEQKNGVVATLRQRMEQAIKAAGVERLRGHARLCSATEVEVIAPGQPAQRRTAEALLLATGTAPVKPKMFPAVKGIFDSTSLLDLDYVPAHLVVVGGGYIGCELACAFQGLGSKVTLIEKEPRLLGQNVEFEAAAPVLQRAFEKRGLAVWTRTEVQSVTAIDDRHLRLHCSNGETLEANAVLLALGRAPQLDGLGIETAGLSLTDQRLAVNAGMQTSVPTIYAVGDLVSPVPLAHVAAREAEVAVAHMNGEKETLNYSTVPRCIYTWPEVAAVGWTQPSAEGSGTTVRIDRFHLAGNSKAMAEQDTEGFWMLFSEPQTRKILGGLIVGAHATELIHLVALSLRAGLTVQDVADTMFAHPTLSESYGDVARRALQQSSFSPGGRR